MDRRSGHKGAAEHLFPPLEPFRAEMMDVGDGHSIYVEQCGNPGGIPVLVLHGGPGGGVSPYMRRFFDPDRFHVVLFDQRGCGRSVPFASVEANTTWHLIRDMEQIRTALGIDSWHLFGGSWGSTLALAYGQEHPDRVLSMILRGIFLMTRPELDWFYGGGAGRFWPEAWARFTDPIPEEEHDDLIAAYYRRLFGEDEPLSRRLAQIWTGWENALASVRSDGMLMPSSPLHARAFARLECHYFHHMGWMDGARAILNRMDRIAHIPALIVQGRQDMICPPVSAHRLAAAWPSSELIMIRDAGHAMSEPGIQSALLQATARLTR